MTQRCPWLRSMRGRAQGPHSWWPPWWVLGWTRWNQTGRFGRRPWSMRALREVGGGAGWGQKS